MYFDCFYCPMQYFCRQYSQGVAYPQSPASDLANSKPPAGPPPPFIPSKTQAMFQNFWGGPGDFMIVGDFMILAPSVIQTNMFSYVYIWLKSGEEFWAWINFVDENFIAGWMWNGSNWVPFKLEIRLIDGIARF